jgi:peptidoglycan/LPS O-acetylase OafA/YrhL
MDFSLVSGGYIGVDIFLVISGFLISRLLLDEFEKTGAISLRQFYARRVRRLLPISSFVLLVTALLGLIILEPTRINNLGDDIWAAGLFSANIVFASRGADYLNSELPPSPIQHFWSLAVEEQFYLIWPTVIFILLVLARKYWRHLALVATLAAIAVSLWASWKQTPLHPSWSYYGLHTRAWQLCCGALLAMTTRKTSIPHRLPATAVAWTSLLAVAYAMYTYNSSTVFPGTAALVPTLAAVGLLWSQGNWFGSQIILNNSIAQWIGSRSYSIYLWHWPLIVLAITLRNDDKVTMVGAVLLAICLSEIGYQIIENPIRNSMRIRQHAKRAFAIGLACIGLTISTGLAISHATFTVGSGIAERANFSDTSYLDAAILNQVLPRNIQPSLPNASDGKPLIYRNGCHISLQRLSETATIPKNCVFGDLESATTVALFGNSHAAQWFVPLEKIARSESWRLRTLTASACSFLSGSNPNVYCDAWRRNVIQAISDQQIKVVIISDFFASVPDDTDISRTQWWTEELPLTISALRAAGAEPIILLDTPRPPEDTPTCLSSHPNNIQLCGPTTKNLSKWASISQAIESVATETGVSVIDPTDWFCLNEICPPVVGDLLVYRDAHHIADLFAGQLEQLLGNILIPLVNQATR